MACAAAIDDVTMDMSCPLCFNLKPVPISLPCFHRICVPCINHLDRSGFFRCPQCKATFPSRTIIEDSELADVINDFPDVQIGTPETTGCAACSAKDVQWRCKDCEDDLCDVCKNTHNYRLNLKPGSHDLIRKQTIVGGKTAEELALGEMAKMADDCRKEQSEIVERYQKTIKSKEALLIYLRQSQQRIADVINTYFASIDEAQRDTTPEEIEVINQHLETLRSDPNNPMLQMPRIFQETDTILERLDNGEDLEEVKEVHEKNMQIFMDYYGTPYKLETKLGDDRSRISYMSQRKSVLETITMCTVPRNATTAEAFENFLPSIQEIQAKTGLSRDIVVDVLSEFDINLEDSELGEGATGNGDVTSGNSDVVSRNSDVRTRNSDMATGNSDIATGNGDVTTKNSSDVTDNGAENSDVGTNRLANSDN